MSALSLVLLVASGCKKDDLEGKGKDGPVELTIFEPEPGAMIDAGKTMVRGKVQGLDKLELNGESVDVDGNLWEAEIDLPRGITQLEVGGLDKTDHRVFLRQSVLAGDFGDPDDTVEQGMGLRLNEGGLDAATNLVADYLDPAQIDAILPSINPVYQDSYGILGIDAVEITADIETIWFDAPKIELTPGAGALQIEVTLPSVYILVPVYGQAIGIDFDTAATLQAAQVVVSGFIELDATDSGGISAGLVAPEMTIDGFYFDTSLLPGSIEDLLLSDTIQGVVQDLVTSQIALLVPDLLDEQLQALKIELETDLLGHTLSLAAGFDTISIDNDGVLLIADLDLGVADADKPTEGYLLSGAEDPRPSDDPALAVLLSDDVVNKLLHDLWRSGLLDLSMSTEDGTLDAFLLEPFGAKEEGAITLDAALPPVLVQDGDEARLQIGELGIRLETPGGDNGDFLDVAVGGSLELDVTLQDGALKFGIGSPDISIMVRDNGWGASDESVTNLLEDELPVDTLLALIGDIEFPLPTIGDITIPDAEVGRTEDGLFTSIDMSF